MTMHVTAVENYKGGTAKTTTASNLAYELSCAGYRTLLVDMDPQQNAAYLLRAKPRKVNLENVLYNFVLADFETFVFFHLE